MGKPGRIVTLRQKTRLLAEAAKKLVPAAPTIITAARKQQHDNEDDQKSRSAHIVLLRESPGPIGEPGLSTLMNRAWDALSAILNWGMDNSFH
jgi:hypothetical protein